MAFAPCARALRCDSWTSSASGYTACAATFHTSAVEPHSLRLIVPAMMHAVEGAASKKGGGGGLKFEAEATAHLQRSGVPVTDDKPKYQPEDVATRLLAILSEGGFVQSTEARVAPRGLSICNMQHTNHTYLTTCEFAAADHATDVESLHCMLSSACCRSREKRS